MQIFYVKSQKLAGYLMLRGFVLHALQPDNNSNRNIFLFGKSDGLLQAIESYKINKWEEVKN